MRDANTYYADLEDFGQVKLAREEEAFQEKVDDLLPNFLFTESGMKRLLGEMDCVEDLAADLAAICAALEKNNRVVLDFALEKLKDRLTAEGRKFVELVAADPQEPIPGCVPALLQEQSA